MEYHFYTRIDPTDNETTQPSTNWNAYTVAYPERTTATDVWAAMSDQSNIWLSIMVGLCTHILSDFATADRPTVYCYLDAAVNNQHVAPLNQVPDYIKLKVTTQPLTLEVFHA